MTERETIVVLDLETSIKNRGDESIGNNKASPFHPDNKIVMFGGQAGKDGEWQPVSTVDYIHSWNTSSLYMLVGHNIKFDVLYLMKHVPNFYRDFKNIKIWDTQLAEYILSGQTKTFPSLDYCAEKYGGTLKDERIKQYWEAGIDTEDIPKDELEEYLRHDVENTKLVFEQQIVQFDNDRDMAFIMSQMYALKSTIEMEFNGMHFDKGKADSFALLLTGMYEAETVDLEDRVRKDLGLIWDDMRHISLASNDVVSALVFGGKIKYKRSEPVLDENGNHVHYKTGLMKGMGKFRMVEHSVITPDNKKIVHLRKSAKKAGYFKVDERTLKEVSKELGGDEIIDGILTLRKLKKDISTYYEGYSKLVWPDGCIHGNLHHCSTATGRLSSSSPNLQNVSGE